MTNTRIKDTLYEDAHLDEREAARRAARELGSALGIFLYFCLFFCCCCFCLKASGEWQLQRISASGLASAGDAHTHTHRHTKKRPHQFGRVHIYPNHTHSRTHIHTLAHSHTRALAHKRSGAVYLCACFFWRSFIILVAVLSHAPLCYAMPRPLPKRPSPAPHIRCSLLSQFS